MVALASELPIGNEGNAASTISLSHGLTAVHVRMMNSVVPFLVRDSCPWTFVHNSCKRSSHHVTGWLTPVIACASSPAIFRVPFIPVGWISTKNTSSLRLIKDTMRDYNANQIAEVMQLCWKFGGVKNLRRIWSWWCQWQGGLRLSILFIPKKRYSD